MIITPLILTCASLAVWLLLVKIQNSFWNSKDFFKDVGFTKYKVQKILQGIEWQVKKSTKMKKYAVKLIRKNPDIAGA